MTLSQQWKEQELKVYLCFSKLKTDFSWSHEVTDQSATQYSQSLVIKVWRTDT